MQILKTILRAPWRKFYGFHCWAREWGPFLVFLLWKCALHRKKAVLVCRFGAMGDVVCSLPLCQAIREKHAANFLIFVTNRGFADLVLQASQANEVFGSRIWRWPFRFPSNFQFLGLVKAIYVPLNTDERESRSGAMLHLIDDMAVSCGLKLRNRQPILVPNKKLIHKTAIQFGCHDTRKLLIALNGGPTWPVKMWSTEKWQYLIERIHKEFEAEIFLLGQKQEDRGGELMALRGVRCLFDQVRPEQIAALLKNCDLLIAIDSGPLHIAGAVGTPVLGLFGANAAPFRLPPESCGMGITASLPCISCQHKNLITHWIENCPHEIACMKAITVDEVFQATKKILEKNPKANFAKR